MKYFLIFCFILSFFSLKAQNSVLSTGDFYKIAVAKHGIYKIDRNFLANLGIDPNSINPKFIQIYANQGGMLPQANNAFRATDLTENAIFVKGQEDEKFDAQDYILFYAEGADKWIFDQENNEIRHEKNLYDNNNYVFLTIGTKEGKRVGNAQKITENGSFINFFNDFRYYENDLENFLGSGRKWYGETFKGLQTEQEFSFSMPNLIENSSLKIITNAIAQSVVVTDFYVYLNGNILERMRMPSVDNPNTNPYTMKAAVTERKITQNVNADLSKGDLKIKLRFDKLADNNGEGKLDFLILNGIRKLALYNSQTMFRTFQSVQNAISDFQISQMDNSANIWEITDFANPRNINYDLSNGNANFKSQTAGKLLQFVVFKGENCPAPVFVEKIAKQNLRAMPTPDVLIITHPDFKDQAERLADFRRKNEGFEVAVAQVQQIYNEFGSGRQDVSAIRDFVRMLYKNSTKLKYLVLFGGASYDYRDIYKNKTNFVPIYESRESLHPINSYASDDFFGFLDENEGEWAENAGGNHVLDIGIGRLPVKNIKSAKDVVDKIIRYQQSSALGNWRNKLCFVGDDGEYNSLTLDTDRLAKQAEVIAPTYNVQKVFIDAFPQVPTGNTKDSPVVRDLVRKNFQDGMFIFNYVGHGSESGLASENVLNSASIGNLDNFHRLPLIVTATCEFGRCDDPQKPSAGEQALNNPKGGAIALLTTTRAVYSDSNFLINSAFYDFVFGRINDKRPTLGDVVRQTKNKSLGIANRNFSLLGDPSMTLAYPKSEILFNSVKENNVSADTLKVLSKITVSGEIKNQGNFNGELQIKIFDKVSELKTLGDFDPDPNSGQNTNYVMAFDQRERMLFRGTASVKNGKFEFSFVVPKDIDYKIGKGKISLYAYDKNSNTDASGALFVNVGGTNRNIAQDNDPPQIKLFMDTTTFVSGGSVDTNAKLIVQLSDASGINISGGLGHDLTAVLNKEQSFVLNEFYMADQDNFQKGTIVFPLRKLKEGKHKLILKAWDTQNNFAENSIEFVVNREKFALQNVLIYPNPVADYANFRFSHNRAGDDLKVLVEIFDILGRLVSSEERDVYSSLPDVTDIGWIVDSGLPVGTYFYRLQVSCETCDDKASTKATGKMVISR
ncbi:MAG: T9SS C-terminal target domain-containing protein [Bacteroidetes bacterium]|nr:MAG: T9SS C-terminal target domain-containing protein [Bacteroidota bacterium]